jgi:hypothetical protein
MKNQISHKALGWMFSVWARRTAIGALILAAVNLAACAGIGPKTVARDRFDYVSAISESWKSQTLLNLLKTRYQDAPIFLDVASVIGQYALEQEVGLGVSGEIYNRGEPSFFSPEITARGRYTDRPTITYNPLMGENFARSLLKPIPIGSILLLVQSGYPIDQVLRICIQAINGLKNHFSTRVGGRKADPEFYEVLTLLRQIQMMDGISFRSTLTDKKESVVMSFREPKTEAQVLKLKRLLHLLGLQADAREFTVVYGAFPVNEKEIAILSRSMIQVMSEYASYIEVPHSDIAEGRVSVPEQKSAEAKVQFPPLIRVRNGTSKPEDAFVAVSYRKHWFWIDDRDLHSKGTFYFLMLMFSFTERGEIGRAAPIITVPTN